MVELMKLNETDHTVLDVDESANSYGDDADDVVVASECHYTKSWPEIKAAGRSKNCGETPIKKRPVHVVNNGYKHRLPHLVHSAEYVQYGQSYESIDELEFIGEDIIKELTLGYVRVRELEKDIERARGSLSMFPSSVSSIEPGIVFEELINRVRQIFDERAKMSKDHSDWKKRKHEQKAKIENKLSKLKNRADFVECKHFQLRKELMALQSVELPKKNLGFIKRLFSSCCSSQ